MFARPECRVKVVSRCYFVDFNQNSQHVSRFLTVPLLCLCRCLLYTLLNSVQSGCTFVIAELSDFVKNFSPCKLHVLAAELSEACCL